MRYILIILLFISLNSFGQLGQTGFNNTDSELQKQIQSTDQCYIDWLIQLGPEHNGQRYPSGTGSRDLKDTKQTWDDLLKVIEIWKAGNVQTIMYVATANEPELSYRMYMEFKKNFPLVMLEWDNEPWLYWSNSDNSKVWFWNSFDIFGIAKNVYKRNATEYSDSFIAFYNYAKSKGITIDKSKIIWTSVYPADKYSLLYFETIYSKLGKLGFKQASFHKYIESLENLEYTKNWLEKFPKDLKLHGTELSFNFMHSATLDYNDNIAFTDTHKEVLVQMFTFFNTVFETTWYHYGVGPLESNYPALVVFKDGSCKNRLEEFLK